MTCEGQARLKQDALRTVLLAAGAMVILYILWRGLPASPTA